MSSFLAPTTAGGVAIFAAIWCSAAVGVLAVQALTRDDFVLRAVRSVDLDHGSGLVEVTAELARYGRDDVALEAPVSRLSLEPSVSSVTWNVVEATVPLAAADE